VAIASPWLELLNEIVDKPNNPTAKTVSRTISESEITNAKPRGLPTNCLTAKRPTLGFLIAKIQQGLLL